MRKGLVYLSTIFAIMCLGLAGCGDSANSTNSVGMVLTIQDATTTGLSVLSFDVQVTNVTLTGTSGTSDAVLLSNPVTVNLVNLMTGGALLANTSAPAGTYSGLKITFASPQLVVLNSTGGTLTGGTTTCPSTTTTTSPCLLSPTLTTSTVTITSAPFPLTLVKGSPVHVAVDFNSSNSITNAAGTVTINPTVTVTTSTALNAKTNNIADFANETGTVTNVGNNQVVVTDMSTGQSLTLVSNSSTKYTGFNTSSTCATANTIGCVAPGQFVNFGFGVSGTAGAMPVLENISLNNGVANGVTGTVVGINAATNQFDVLVTSETPGFASQNPSFSVGHVVVVNLASGATFSAQTNGVTLPSGLTFSNFSNIGIGQTVLLNSTAFTAGTGSNPGTLTANSVVLEPSQFTGTVGTINSANQSFTMTGLNGLFTLNTIPLVTVDTLSGTTFIGVPGFTSLAPGQTTTTAGLVFVTPSGLVVVGTQIVGNM